jgi:Ca-activated chloride channel family protein
VEVTAVAADGRATQVRTLPMPETAPGRYEAAFRPDIAAGALLFNAAFTAGGAPATDATGRLTLPFAPELMPRPPSSTEGTAELAAAAAASGGRVVHDAREVLDPGRDHRETGHPLRTPILLVTLVLFVADVALRRVRLPEPRPGIDSRR